MYANPVSRTVPGYEEESRAQWFDYNTNIKKGQGPF